MFNKQLLGNNKVQNYGNSVGGFLFKWETKDSLGNMWTPETNFYLDWYGRYPILFNHGRHPEVGLEKLGTIYEIRKTEEGLMLIGSLDPESQWYEAICVLKDKDSLLWGASPVQHLASSEDGVWLSYPIAELSLVNIGPENFKNTISIETVDPLPSLSAEKQRELELDPNS